MAGSGNLVFYTCPAAQREYNAIGCVGQLPIETTMPKGSSCVHWKESIMLSELMSREWGPELLPGFDQV